MADEKTYDVVIQHDGDRQYWAGETRTLLKSDGDQLVKMGLLREQAAQKPEQAPLNKAEQAPVNKAEGSPEVKVVTASRGRRRKG